MGKVTAWRPWIRGLLTTVISGVAHSIIGALSAIGIAPETFNFSGGLHKLIEITLLTGAASAVVSLMTFLQKSPIPEEIEVQTSTINPQDILGDKK